MTGEGGFQVLKGYVGSGLGFRFIGCLSFNLADRYDMISVQNKILKEVKADFDKWNMVARSFGMSITVYERYR